MNVFMQLLKSLYSPSTIMRFRFQRIGKTIAFIFLFMFIVSIPNGIMLTNTMIQWTNQAEAFLHEDAPHFHVERGTLYSDVAEPVIIEKEDGAVFIFDASGSLTIADVKDYKDAIALLKDEAVIVHDGRTNVFAYKTIEPFNLSKDAAADLVQTVKGLLPLAIPLLFIAGYLLNTAFKFIEIFALSIIGTLVRKRTKVNVSYRQMWTMSTYAIVLPTLLFALINTLRLTIPYSFAAYWLVAIVMICATLSNLPNRKN